MQGAWPRTAAPTHTEFEVTADAWALLPRLVWEFGQPFADPACIPTYYVAERARRYVTVALTGDGGDESFAGYSQHQGRYLGALLQRVVPTAVVDRLLRGSTRLDGRRAAKRAAQSAARFLRYMHRRSAGELGRCRRLGPPPPAASVERPVPGPWRARRAARVRARGRRRNSTATSALDRALHHDLNVLLPFCYNVKVDVATMMSSLEARSPFQDREVVEWAARLPADVKMRPWEKKALLKRVAARWLPRDVVYRPKHGFSLPVDAWFRGPWAAAAHDLIFSDQARDRGYFDYEYLETTVGGTRLRSGQPRRDASGRSCGSKCGSGCSSIARSGTTKMEISSRIVMIRSSPRALAPNGASDRPFLATMHWKIKAAIQNAMARLPPRLSYRAYYRMQRMAGGLRVLNPVEHLAAGIEMWNHILNQGQVPQNKVFLEVGTGRVPIVPLAFWLMGAGTHDYSRREPLPQRRTCP